jgi:predicted DNA-binding transcriptional regulator YafY
MKPELERKFALLNLLASSLEPLTYEEIFNRLSEHYPAKGKTHETVKKMFERDKADLNSEGFIIAAEEDGEGVEKYILPKHQAWLKGFELTESQAQSLREALEDPAIAGQMMGQSLFALKKLLAFSAPFDENLQGEENKDPVETAKYLKVLDALLDEKVIEVEYPDHQGVPEARFFSPYKFFFLYGRTLLIAGCHRTLTPKVIELSKVKSIRFAKKSFIPPPADFDAGQYIHTGKYNYDPGLGTLVQFRVKAEEVWRIRERNSQWILSIQKDGSALCEYFVTNDDAFFMMILAFGPNAEILSPTAYRLKFKKFHLKAAL